MEKIKVVIDWFNGLSRRGKALVVIGTAAVIFIILEGLKS